MAHSSKEWASLQENKISICFDSADSLLSLQAHCAHYAWDAWWASDKSPLRFLVTRIFFQVLPDILAMELKEKTKDTLGKHTVLKSNA